MVCCDSPNWSIGQMWLGDGNVQFKYRYGWIILARSRIFFYFIQISSFRFIHLFPWCRFGESNWNSFLYISELLYLLRIAGVRDVVCCWSNPLMFLDRFHYFGAWNTSFRDAICFFRLVHPWAWFIRVLRSSSISPICWFAGWLTNLKCRGILSEI